MDERDLRETPEDVIDAPQETEETVETSSAPDSSHDIETRARAMGWRPQDEFNGDPGKWRSAEEFVQRGESDLPILRENLRRMTSQVTDLQSRLSRQDHEFKNTIQRIEKMSDAALRRQREQIEESYSAAMRSAAAAGDIDQYQRLEVGKATAISDFDQRVAEVREPAPPQPQEPTNNPEYRAKVQEWMQRNTWYRTDPELHAAATAYSKFVAGMNPDITLEDNLKETEEYMRRKYADRLGLQQKSARGGPAPVEGGGSRMAMGSGGGRGWNDLPADARAQGDKFIQDGLFKDRADYAKEYWSQ